MVLLGEIIKFKGFYPAGTHTGPRSSLRKVPSVKTVIAIIISKYNKISKK